MTDQNLGALVTTVDQETGETETAYCAPDNYVIVTGPKLWVSNVQRYHGTGTIVVTMKRVQS